MTLPWMAERIQLHAIASLRPHAGNAWAHGMPLRMNGQALKNLGLIQRENEWLYICEGWLACMSQCISRGKFLPRPVKNGAFCLN